MGEYLLLNITTHTEILSALSAAKASPCEAIAHPSAKLIKLGLHQYQSVSRVSVSTDLPASQIPTRLWKPKLALFSLFAPTTFRRNQKLFLLFTPLFSNRFWLMLLSISVICTFLTLLVAIHNPHSLHFLKVRNLIASWQDIDYQRGVKSLLEI